MIVYNFPYRGPLEYEKFVLNFMQLHNEAIMLKTKNTNTQNLKNNIDKLFNKYINNNFQEAYYRFL